MPARCPRRAAGKSTARRSQGCGYRRADLMSRPIRHLRWYIGGLLFLSTVINYIDRQTLSVLAPILKDQFHLDEHRLRAGPHRVPRRLRGRADHRGRVSRPARARARA